MKRMSMTCVVSLVAVMVLASGVQAGFLYPWDPTPTISDANETGIGDGQDILGAWHAYDGQYHYFRIDLEGQPTTASGNWAEIYGIYIDTVPGGGGNDDIQYIPAPMDGIDYILDSHFDDSNGSWEVHHYHIWSPYLLVFNYGVMVADQQTENGNRTLEWQVDDDLIGTEFTWLAADLTQGLPSTTHDITDSVYFPEPATAMLVMIGLGFGLVRRRRG